MGGPARNFKVGAILENGGQIKFVSYVFLKYIKFR